MEVIQVCFELFDIGQEVYFIEDDYIIKKGKVIGANLNKESYPPYTYSIDYEIEYEHEEYGNIDTDEWEGSVFLTIEEAEKYRIELMEEDSYGFL